MAPEVLAAIVGGAVALALAGANVLLVRRQMSLTAELETTKAELARQTAADKAKLDYEYEARRRLYERFEPLVFQLMELSDYALDRIKNLTDPSVWQELAVGDRPPPGAGRPPMAAGKYEVVSTLYGLYSPLVVTRFMSQSLTLVDLSLEPRIQLQYHLASRLYGCIKDDKRLAQFDPPLAYDPFAEGWREKREVTPGTYWWQGLTMGRLETVLDLMTVEPAGESPRRLMSFGEFERFYMDAFAGDDERTKKTLAVAANAIYRFKPPERPVFWRMLITQARLYQAILRTRAPTFTVSPDSERWKELLHLEDCQEFDWRADADRGAPIEEVVSATNAYLDERVYRTWLTQWARGRRSAAAP